MILAGDLGGTKCNLALFEREGEKFRLVGQRRFSSKDYARAEDMVAEFRRSFPGSISAVGLGIAAPILGETIRFTNVPLVLDSRALARMLGLPRVTLLNDMEATGYSLEHLDADKFFTLNAGVSVPGATQALIAAGTGLGEALLWWDGRRRVVVPTEGGHTDFAPRTEEEIELLRFLKKRYRHVSNEHVLSGRGFAEIHEFLDPSVSHFRSAKAEADPAPEITRRGLDGSCPACVGTLNLWVMLYGAEAGNLALKSLATGGVYVAGGIAVRLLDRLKDGKFVRAFCDKSKFSTLLSQIPIQVVLDEQAPLLGAAARAAAIPPT